MKMEVVTRKKIWVMLSGDLNKRRGQVEGMESKPYWCSYR